MSVRIFLLAVLVGFLILFEASMSDPVDPFYTIRGIALDYSTGAAIALGNVTLTIKENGVQNTSIIKDGVWIANVSTTADYNANRWVF